jgi:dTDP-4-dehydrorhamnose reductase
MDIKQNNSTLIVGGDSTIGGRLVAAFEDDCNPIWQTTRHHTKVNDKCLFLDLSDDMNCWHLKHESFKTSIFCAAITSHEQCQLDSELSWHVNVKGTVALATRMAEAGTFVIFISSNAVFNGESPFVRPNDPVTPQTEYGRQKAEAEEQLLKLGDKVAIVRFSKVITPEMPLISRWIRDLKAGIVIHPFIDMVIAPVPIAFAVAVLREVAVKQVSGIIQVSSNQDVTYAVLARHITLKLGVNEELVKPISYKDVGLTYAARNTTLDTSRLYELGLLPPDIWTGVDDTFELDIS